jgi:hypothetical protein
MLPKNLKFRPQDFSVQINGGPYWRSIRGKGYNWQRRRSTIADPVVRIFSHIHYLTAHAPAKVKQRWANAARIWRKKMQWHKAGINERL